MPNMPDPRFEKAVIMLCVHNADGAMGVVINRQSNSISYPELLQQLTLPTHIIDPKKPVFYGGPIEAGRGFVLHSDDVNQESTLKVSDGIALTATVDILRTIAEGRGPNQSLLALGYAGWGAGQLEYEIQNNSWLTVPPDAALLFDDNVDTKWHRAMSKIGVSLHHLSDTAGHA
ncbi:MAG: YqgE/AlgH family protein [Alphaproteobacteria bacterium]|nr:MAG: YqgE/AlgH family protein [Alphaproteobacteria bacterium]